MEFLPVFFDVKNRPCLVVGGQEAAYRKISLLLKAGAAVKVVAPDLCSKIADLKKEGAVEYKSEEFSENDLDNCGLVIAATEDEDLMRRTSKLAQERNIPVNVVDRPDLCTFITPAIVDRSPLVIAVSTGGTSPVLARTIRSRIEAMLPQSYGRLAEMIGSFRDKVKSLYKSVEERRLFWNKVFSGSIVDAFLSGRENAARKALKDELRARQDSIRAYGQVCLIGAGPGDPNLLTLRALRLIQNADTIVYDRLVFPSILDYARRDVELIYVGKKSSKHIVPQEQINEILVDLAKQGKMVVRLKGGDPFIFGRGGEEIEMLLQKGVDFQVVPGITAASGCSSYAGIPLTHRDYAQSCILVTGHLKNGGMDLNWQSLVQPGQTIVFYMGVANIKLVCEGLTEHGMSPDMPAAVIQKGTTRNQKVFTGLLRNLPDIVEKFGVQPPSLIIVGEVVKLREKIKGTNPDF